MSIEVGRIHHDVILYSSTLLLSVRLSATDSVQLSTSSVHEKPNFQPPLPFYSTQSIIPVVVGSRNNRGREEEGHNSTYCRGEILLNTDLVSKGKLSIVERPLPFPYNRLGITSIFCKHMHLKQYVITQPPFCRQ